ncbi:TPA: phosphoglycerate kinase [Candidatus Poribacteria bacterium]|nr:phosphoglycerate kinase [Candidatus Poribacteria bacterium]
MEKLSITDLDIKGKRVLVRVDFNVPLENGQVVDDTRIEAALDTIKYISDNGGKALLISHLGRPEGCPTPELSLTTVSQRLSELLGKEVKQADDCVGPQVKALVDGIAEGDVVMLENVRFHPEEEKNDAQFAEQLASLADVYVNDAFGAAHRAHASTVGVTRYFKESATGFLLENEIKYLSQIIENPQRPLLAILGGKKVSDKIGVINSLLEKADAIIIGGGMTYTFLKAEGKSIGDSFVEDDKLDIARYILIKSLVKGVPIHLPLSHVVVDEFKEDANVQVVKRGCIPDGWEGVDIGLDTVEKFKFVIARAKTIVWNGPLGVFEFDRFAKGTTAIAKIVADSSATTIIGGGDIVAAVQKAGVADKITHISTGGGASLEFLEGKELPGVAALTDR